MRQLIIARKDLNMSSGKLASQVAHASMAFMSYTLRSGEMFDSINEDQIVFRILLNKEIWMGWFNGIFTKTVCEAKNRNHLLKVTEKAKELGLEEGKDYFLIKDNCLTELTPEEFGEDGVGRVLTCIGFRPLSDDISHQLSKKYQLFR